MNRTHLANVIAFAACFGLTAWCHNLEAAPGDLDPAFGAGGRVLTDFGGSNDGAQSVTLLPNGKLLVAGDAVIAGVYHFALARYHTNGNLDASFGVNGRAVTDFGFAFARGHSVVLQHDGKILVTGFTDNGANNDFAVARYLPNGLPDTSFSTDGKVITGFIGGHDSGNSVVVQPDGKILVAGNARIGTDDDFALVRYQSDGKLDTTFSIASTGKVTTHFGSGDDSGECVVLQPDGKILVAGSAKIGADNDFALARYHANGTLDTSFDTDGITSTHFGVGNDGIESIVLLSDGKILAAGTAAQNSTGFDFALARYHANGSRDNTFGTDGKVTADFAGDLDAGASLAVQTDGKILVAGYATVGGTGIFGLARFLPDGALDTTFHGDGKLTTGFGGSHASGKGVAFQTNGRIVVVGFMNLIAGGSEFALARYQGIIFQPDNRIGPRRNRQKGDNIYNLTGARQKTKFLSRNGRKLKFIVTVQNDAVVGDALFVRAPRKNRHLRVTYRTPVFGNVTATITRGGFGFLNVGSGQTKTFTVQAKPKNGSAKTTALRVISNSFSDPTRKDVVVAKVKPKP